MRKILAALVTVSTAIALFLLHACATQKTAPDPDQVEAEIAEFRQQELELVRDTIVDRDRAERVIELLAQRDKLVAQHTEEIRTYRESMSVLNANYHADREGFETLMATYNSQRASAQKEFVDLIAAIKADTTPQEWKAISRFQLKRLHPRRLTYGQASGGA